MSPLPYQSNFQPSLPAVVKDLLFSYHVHQAITLKKTVLTVQQQETNFILSIQVINHGQHRLVKSFKIQENHSLEEHSEALYDAAILELAIQGLYTLFAWGHQQGLRFLTFHVPSPQWASLSAFESFFHTADEEGSILSITPRAYQLFQQNIDILHLKIRMELWKHQREDKLVQAYLQDAIRPCLLFPKASAPKASSQVIAFIPTRHN